jgi:hypothetical protein
MAGHPQRELNVKGVGIHHQDDKEFKVYISKSNPVIQAVRSSESNFARAYKENKISKKYYSKTFYPTKHLITRWFNILNEEIFNNQVHPFYDIEILQKKGCHAEHIPYEEEGEKVFGVLSIADRFINRNEFLFTLAHEMVHQWQWMTLNRTDHGESFFKWKNKFAQFEIPLGVSI